jgi:hypothetical protein
VQEAEVRLHDARAAVRARGREQLERRVERVVRLGVLAAGEMERAAVRPADAFALRVRGRGPARESLVGPRDRLVDPPGAALEEGEQVERLALAADVLRFRAEPARTQQALPARVVVAQVVEVRADEPQRLRLAQPVARRLPVRQRGVPQRDGLPQLLGRGLAARLPPLRDEAQGLPA